MHITMAYMLFFCLIVAGFGTMDSVPLGSSVTSISVKIQPSYLGTSGYLIQQGMFNKLSISSLQQNNRGRYRFTLWAAGGKTYVMITGLQDGQVKRVGSNVQPTGFGSLPTNTNDNRVWECISVSPWPNACSKLSGASPYVTVRFRKPNGSNNLCHRTTSNFPYLASCGTNKRHWEISPM